MASDESMNGVLRMPSPITTARAGWGLALCLASGMGAAAELGLGVVSPTDGAQLYASDPAGFVHAVNLQDGQTRWVSADRAVPLALHEDRLVALAAVEQFGLGMLVLIDPASGQVLDRIAFDLPETVSAELSSKPQRRFRMFAEPRSQGLRLHWSYQSRPLRGARLDESEDSTTPSDGRIQLNGALDLLQDAQGARVLPLDAALAAPAVMAAMELDPAARVPGLAGRQFVGPADDVVLHSEERTDAARGVDYRWDLLRRSGQRLGSLSTPFAYAPFVVRDTLLIYRVPAHGQTDARGVWTETPPQLLAWDLRQARVVWRFDVLDAEYRGPMPP